MTALLFGSLDYFTGAHEPGEAIKALGVGVGAGLATWVIVFVLGLVTAPRRIRNRASAEVRLERRNAFRAQQPLELPARIQPNERDDSVVDITGQIDAAVPSRLAAFSAEGIGLLQSGFNADELRPLANNWIVRLSEYVRISIGHKESLRLAYHAGLPGSPYSGTQQIIWSYLQRLKQLQDEWHGIKPPDYPVFE